MDESIIGSALELLKGAWEFGPLVKISKVLALLGLTAIFSALESSPLCGCGFGSLVLTLTVKHGDREEEVLYKNIPVSEVVERDNIYDKKERLMIMEKIQKSSFVAVAV